MDRRDVDEVQEAFGRLVVACCDASCVFEPIEAALDQVAQAIKQTIRTSALST